eukprot:TRINITY_DN16024_c0_g1_i1.p1 TRINITY_DN16024_c0_g1~~TRINITY_DN16024_c0_g1_i1.p1  ORF type:complete len:506 (+),score=119.22 TRINITY_DN16024_c0_g1_i1:103-1620(+)
MAAGSVQVPPELEADLQMLLWMLPDQDPRSLVALLQQHSSSSSGGGSGGVNPARLNDLVQGMLEGAVAAPQTGPLPRTGHARKEQVVFETLEMNEDFLYDWGWKSIHEADDAAVPQAAHEAPLQGLADGADGAAGGDEGRDERFMLHHSDAWIEPMGERARWVAGGQCLPDAEGAQPPPEDNLDFGALHPPSEEVAHWTQDWENESDDDELLDARTRLGVYADTFSENNCMRVATELRKNPRLFEAEKKEVLQRALLTATKTLLNHQPQASTSPVAGSGASPDDSDAPGAAPAPIVLVHPFARVLELVGFRFLASVDAPVVFADLDLDNAENAWELPTDHPNATYMRLKDASFELSPLSWQCRGDKCCCVPCGPCFCTDMGVTTVKGKADIAALVDLYLHPTAQVPPTVYDLDVAVSELDVKTSGALGCCSCAPETTAPLDIPIDNKNCMKCRRSCCASWQCSMPSWFYSCCFAACNPCIRGCLRHQLAQAVPDLLSEPPPQKPM